MLSSCAGQDEPAEPATSPSAPVQTTDNGNSTFGSTRSFPDGLTVTVSRPKQFQPSDMAYPRARRAVSFEVTVDNARGASYQLSNLSITMTADGQPMKQVVDSTQGFTGMGSAERMNIAAGRNVQLNVAFTVPTEPVELEMMVQPDTSRVGPPLTFTGTA